MDITRLRYFYTVAGLEHVTRAAEQLHVAQPAITKSIKLLESDLGVSLFRRDGRNIKLTEYGRLLKSKLDSVFPVVDEIPGEIERLKNENKVTVKLNVLAASTAVMDAVIKFKNKNPEVIFNLIQNEEKYDCDVSVTTNYTVSEVKEVKERCIMEEKIYLAVPKNSKYKDYKKIELKEVKDEKFINLASSRSFRTICDKFCSYAGFKPKIAFESDSPIAVKNIIAAEAGVGFWPEYSWGKIKSSDVVLIPITNPTCQRELIIELHEGNERSEYVRAFYEYLIKALHKKQNA